MVKRALFTFIFAAFYSLVFCWGGGPGTTGNNFLKISPDARSAAMADAFIAVSDGTYGLFYNPAGLNTILGYETQLTHISWFEGMNYEYAAFVNPDPLLDWGKIGLAIAYFTPGTMSNSVSLPSYDYSYLNSGADIGQYIGGKYDPKSYSIIFGYSLEPTEDISLGLKIKLTTEYLQEYKDSDVSAGLGIIYKTLLGDNYIRFAALVDNLGTKVTLGDDIADPPMALSVGVSDQMQINDWDFLLSVQTIMQWDNAAVFSMGVEYWLYDCFALRLGVKIADNILPTFGAGYRYKNFEFDYAFANYDLLGATNRFTLVAAWGTPPARLALYPYKISPNGDGYFDTMYFMPILQDSDMLDTVKINIYDAKGDKPVTSITAKSPDESKIAWDGKKDGKPLPDGKYTASVDAIYSVNGDSESKKVEIEIDNTPPEVSMEAGPVFNRPGKAEALLIPVTFTFFARDNSGIDRWQLVIWDKHGKVFFSTAGMGMPPLSYEWDGKGSNAGEYARTGEVYYYSFYAWDPLNNRAFTEPAGKVLLVREIKIIFSSDALFDPGLANVKVSAFQMVKQMKRTIDQYPGTQIVVAGHTDNNPPSKKYSDNFELSKERAEAVKFFMVNMMGMDASRIVTEGNGDTYPMAANSTVEGRAKNRRVEIIIRSTVYK
jgi:flagellar motor protein MotB